MKAHARVVAEHSRGRSRCTTLHSAPPLAFRATAEGIHMVATAAGPVGGDDLTIEVTVARGAALVVRSVAAQMVLPAPRPAPSVTRLAVDVGHGARLTWSPEPTVVVRGADHRLATTIDLGAGADLTWRDEVVLGRDGEAGGSLLTRLRVERAGSPLLCTEVALGPGWPTSGGPAGTGGARVVATALFVGRPARAVLAIVGDEPARSAGADGARVAACRLGEDAVLLTALGHRLDATRAVLALVGV